MSCVVGIGVAPRTELAEKAGIEVQNGVLTNEYLETSSPGIFAAGDLANAFHPLFDERVRRRALGQRSQPGTSGSPQYAWQSPALCACPYFYSDQYDVAMEYSGYAPDWDEVVFRGDVSSREFIAFYVKQGRVAAGMNVNIEGVSGKISRPRVVASSGGQDRAGRPRCEPGRGVKAPGLVAKTGCHLDE